MVRDELMLVFCLPSLTSVHRLFVSVLNANVTLEDKCVREAG